MRENGNLRDGSHLHKCIIMLSDHADTQRHEMLVKLAVQKSALLLNVASQRVNKCEDTMTDTLQTFLKTERSLGLSVGPVFMRMPVYRYSI